MIAAAAARLQLDALGSRVEPGWPACRLTEETKDYTEALSRLTEHAKQRRLAGCKGAAIPALVTELLSQVAPVSREGLREANGLAGCSDESRCVTSDQAAFLNTLAHQGPAAHQLLLDRVESQGCQVWHEGELWEVRDARAEVVLKKRATSCRGLWCGTNPVGGGLVMRNDKGALSRRAERCLVRANLLNLEIDLHPPDYAGDPDAVADMALTLASVLPVPVLTATYSGGISTHCTMVLPGWRREALLEEQLAAHKA